MRQVSRRNFLKFCTASGVVLGLDPLDMTGLNRALANPNGPTVLWLQGSGCTGCTMSLLDYISPTAPTDIADVLINYINLAYHPNLIPAAGESAAAVIDQAYQSGNYVLAVEGGIPTAFDGAACWAWTVNGRDVTFAEAVTQLAARAAAILCMGTCASWGGIPAAGPNPTGIVGVGAFTGRPTINIGGCPPHPNWMVWAIVQLLLGKSIAVDTYRRPTAIYGQKFHERCPLKETDEINTYGVPNRCLKALGCRGPETFANCDQIRWNNGVNWCIGAGAPCIGCTSPSFPGTNALNRQPA